MGPGSPKWKFRCKVEERVRAMKAGLFVATVVFCDCLSAQIVTTVAGSDWIFPQQPIPGVGAPLGALGCNPGLCGVNGVAVNSRGAAFLSRQSTRLNSSHANM